MSSWAEEPWHGLPAQVVTTDTLRLVVVPALGGKIASLVDANGREWLAQPEPGTQTAVRAARFVDAEMCGWDECLPTIVACTVQQTRLPDHGEVWQREWQAAGTGNLVVDGPSWNYRFSRYIAVGGSAVDLRYTVQARDQRVHLLWAAHPQFRAAPGTVVELPSSTGPVWDVLSTPPELVREATTVCGLDSLGPGEIRKFYLDPAERPRSARLRHADGATLTMDWSPEIRYLGIWFDRSHFARGDVIAIEPSSGWYDSCEEASKRGRVAVVQPRQAMTWSIRLSVHP